ncbi:CFEM domain-containing protein [Sarocladium implicatum]|nr:CFEM domain-containing protein [Sarocladium implicatum]
MAVAQELSMPACAETCFATGAEGSDCSGAQDLECLCDNASFNIDFVNCVSEACEADDVTDALETYEPRCSEIGVPINVIPDEEVPTGGAVGAQPTPLLS